MLQLRGLYVSSCLAPMVSRMHAADPRQQSSKPMTTSNLHLLGTKRRELLETEHTLVNRLSILQDVSATAIVQDRPPLGTHVILACSTTPDRLQMLVAETDSCSSRSTTTIACSTTSTRSLSRTGSSTPTCITFAAPTIHYGPMSWLTTLVSFCSIDEREQLTLYRCQLERNTPQYVAYFAGYEHGSALARSYTKGNKQFEDFASSTKLKTAKLPDSRNSDLNALLAEPVQRVPRYKYMLKGTFLQKVRDCMSMARLTFRPYRHASTAT